VEELRQKLRRITTSTSQGEISPNIYPTPGHIFIYISAPILSQALKVLSDSETSIHVYALTAIDIGSISPGDKESTTEFVESQISKGDRWDRALRTWFDNANERKRLLEQDLHFRVTCYRCGHHIFQSSELARWLGSGLVGRYNWKVNLSYPRLEVYLRVHNRNLISGIRMSVIAEQQSGDVGQKYGRRMGITKKRHKGFQLLNVALQPPIASALSRLSSHYFTLSLGRHPAIALDPFAGTGSIGIHGSKACWLIMGDADDEAVQAGKTNVRNSGSQCSVLHLNAKRIPVRSGVIDVVVTDAPFGHRCNNKKTIKSLYPKAILEFSRLLTPKGILVFMTSEEEESRVEGCLRGKEWKILEKRLVLMGFVCVVVIARKT